MSYRFPLISALASLAVITSLSAAVASPTVSINETQPIAPPTNPVITDSAPSIQEGLPEVPTAPADTAGLPTVPLADPSREIPTLQWARTTPFGVPTTPLFGAGTSSSTSKSIDEMTEPIESSDRVREDALHFVRIPQSPYMNGDIVVGEHYP